MLALASIAMELGIYTFAEVTPDPRTGVTQLTFASPPAAGSSNVEVFYVPLFYVRVDSVSRDFPEVHRETRAMTLVEV